MFINCNNLLMDQLNHHIVLVILDGVLGYYVECSTVFYLGG